MNEYDTEAEAVEVITEALDALGLADDHELVAAFVEALVKRGGPFWHVARYQLTYADFDDVADALGLTITDAAAAFWQEVNAAEADRLTPAQRVNWDHVQRVNSIVGTGIPVMSRASGGAGQVVVTAAIGQPDEWGRHSAYAVQSVEDPEHSWHCGAFALTFNGGQS